MDLWLLKIIETHIFDNHMVKFSAIEVAREVKLPVRKELIISHCGWVRFVLPNGSMGGLDYVFVFYMASLIHVCHVDVVHREPHRVELLCGVHKQRFVLL